LLAIADAWNDFVDIASATATMTALGVTLWDPSRFLAADHYGGFAVGLIVIFIGIRVTRHFCPLNRRHARSQSPRSDPASPAQRSWHAGVEKLLARGTGLQYHVDLHLEVDPKMKVRQAHDIATEVRFAIRRQLNWVADVLVHVEPGPGPTASQTKQ